MKTKWLWLVLAWGVSGAQAEELVLDVTKGTDRTTTIAVAPFAGEGTVDGIVSKDLRRTGLFDPMDASYMLSRPTSPATVNWSEWKNQNTDYLVAGSISRTGTGMTAQFWLMDVPGQAVLLEGSASVRGNDNRALAHKVADQVFQKITGLQGAFNTNLVYVTRVDTTPGKGSFTLWLADADGERARPILKSNQPILSPSWSPDGARLAYVSYEGGRPGIWVHDLRSNRRNQITFAPGINGAPAWSPDGSRLAIVLSYGSNPDVYILGINGGEARRITSHAGIDTEPAWFPDGQSIAFTSDRSGYPNIYRQSLNGGEAERLTFEGSYNARPTVLDKGETIGLLHRPSGGGGFHIAYQHLKTGRLTVLPKTQVDESPAMAPNGIMAVYATGIGKASRLMVTSSNGAVVEPLPAPPGDVRVPAWSPITGNR